MEIYEERVATLLVLLDAEFDVRELPADWTDQERSELMRLVMWCADEEVGAWAELAKRPARSSWRGDPLFQHAVNSAYRRQVFQEALALGAEPSAHEPVVGAAPLYELMRRPRRRPR